MEKFNWSSDYGVGVAEIDEQHKYFFNIANELIDLADRDETSKEELFTLLGKLGDYALYHLGTEEEYFDKFEYPDTAPHRAAHDNYRETIKRYLSDIRDENADVPGIAKKAALYSSGWLAGHIIGMDQMYSTFFNEHGLN